MAMIGVAPIHANHILMKSACTVQGGVDSCFGESEEPHHWMEVSLMRGLDNADATLTLM